MKALEDSQNFMTRRVSKTTKIELKFSQNWRDQHYKLRVDQFLSEPFLVLVWIICIELGWYLFLTAQELVNL